MKNRVSLRPITLEECQQVRIWRNDPDVAPMLRTGAKTEEEQAAFYRDVICNHLADHWYWAIESNGQFCGIGGLTYLSRGWPEISLVLGPNFRQRGIGSATVEKLLDEAWAHDYSVVTGECYPVGAIAFWTKQALRHPPATLTIHPDGGLAWQWIRPCGLQQSPEEPSLKLRKLQTW